MTVTGPSLVVIVKRSISYLQVLEDWLFPRPESATPINVAISVKNYVTAKTFYATVAATDNALPAKDLYPRTNTSVTSNLSSMKLPNETGQSAVPLQDLPLSEPTFPVIPYLKKLKQTSFHHYTHTLTSRPSSSAPNVRTLTSNLSSRVKPASKPSRIGLPV